MPDDRHLRQSGVLAGHGPALRPLARILQRLEIAGVPQGDRAQPDAEAGLIHHVEHVGKAAVGFPDQVPDRPGPAPGLMPPFTEIQCGIGYSAVAHLVVEAGQHDIVAFADSFRRPRRGISGR